MRAQVRVSFARLAALCALAFGVLAMHHVTTGPLVSTPSGADSAHHALGHQSGTGSDGSADAPIHPPDHDSFHMCLAVLLAATLTLAVWLLLRTAREQRVRPRRASGPARRAGRGPPFAPSTSVFLSSLCILRV
ncbi:DUF6153 family protein [Rhodococcus sp. AG1013]|uniref:DUF6153 family protein n=1 Tax=unclassified Rhodococcus (in: high G+C Gram-positive bacteria) TaxID=192944 RepID=UPI000E0AAA30|nr:DUF6153 family protein [Rhodococcus sp. AG1013]RDI36000.1 hypothetical protein DEU38_101480 [Rhodococcus sp. AG1013]